MSCFAEITEEVLLKEGYTACISDPCLYMKSKPPLLSFIAVHVDDFPCVSNNPTEPQRLEISMAQYWKPTLSPTINRIVEHTC